jgi:NTE family protein
MQKKSKVLLVEPDGPARAAIGPNPLDPAVGPEAARAGRAQAGAVAEDVRALWQ